MMKKTQRLTNGLLITLLVIVGLGALTYTGKLLDEKYQWVEKLKDTFTKDEEAISEDISEALSEDVSEEVSA